MYFLLYLFNNLESGIRFIYTSKMIYTPTEQEAFHNVSAFTRALWTIFVMFLQTLASGIPAVCITVEDAELLDRLTNMHNSKDPLRIF